MNKIQEKLNSIKGQWAEVARIAGVSSKTVYRIANGEYRDHRISTVEKIAAAADVVALLRSREKAA